MSTTNHTDNCSFSPHFTRAADFFFYLTYFGITPVVNILFIPAYILAIRAFYLESKSEGAYRYQICSTACDLISSFGEFFHAFNTGLIGLPGFERHDSVAQYHKSIWWFNILKAHFSSPFDNTLITTGLLLSMCLALDRIAAIWSPIKYKLANHSRRMSACVSLCTFVGVGTSLYDCFRWKVVAEEPTASSSSSGNETSYHMILNSQYTGSSVWIFFNQLRNAVRFCSWSALVITNVVLLIVYDRRMKKSQLITHVDDQKSKQAKKKQKVLFVLTICQCSTKTLTTFFILIVYSLYTFFPRIYECGFTLMAPMLDACTGGLMPALDLSLVVIMSGTFRRMLRRAIRKGGLGGGGANGSSVVAPAQTVVVAGRF